MGMEWMKHELASQQVEEAGSQGTSSLCVRLCVLGNLVKIVVRLQDDAIRYSSKVFSFSIGQARS